MNCCVPCVCAEGGAQGLACAPHHVPHTCMCAGVVRRSSVTAVRSHIPEGSTHLHHHRLRPARPRNAGVPPTLYTVHAGR